MVYVHAAAILSWPMRTTTCVFVVRANFFRVAPATLAGRAHLARIKLKLATASLCAFRVVSTIGESSRVARLHVQLVSKGIGLIVNYVSGTKRVRALAMRFTIPYYKFVNVERDLSETVIRAHRAPQILQPVSPSASRAICFQWREPVSADVEAVHGWTRTTDDAAVGKTTLVTDARVRGVLRARTPMAIHADRAIQFRLNEPTIAYVEIMLRLIRCSDSAAVCRVLLATVTIASCARQALF
jgi:DNA-binding Lrp family transcriptional regulator